MNFASDNVAGAHPALLQALADINDQTLNAYGEDPFNAQVEQECRRIFEHDRLKTVLVGTGSAANALALATMTPAWGAIYCHRTSHIVVNRLEFPSIGHGMAMSIGHKALNCHA